MARPATNEILDALRSEIGDDNLVRSCGGEGCPVDMADIPLPRPTARLKCRPILIHGRSLDRRERKTLNRAKIRFRGQHLTIATARCGRPKNLAGALQLPENRA